MTELNKWNNNNSNIQNKQWNMYLQIRQNRNLIVVPVVWCPSMLCVYGCVFCSISFLSVYMCVRLPWSPWSIAGVTSSQALPGYLITAHHLCIFYCHRPWQWILALARVLVTLAAQEKSTCQQFKLWGVLCLRPLTPGSFPRCVSALWVRVGQAEQVLSDVNACAVAVIATW